MIEKFVPDVKLDTTCSLEFVEKADKIALVFILMDLVSTVIMDIEMFKDFVTVATKKDIITALLDVEFKNMLEMEMF